MQYLSRRLTTESQQRLQAGAGDGVEEMLPQLLDIALSPYLGPREALGLASAARGV